MTTVPTTEPERRTIGDILLEHGFVSEEALASATAEQARTAQPLGQILVQAGAITRLELASALAEQWSDPSVSITPLPRPTRGLASSPGRSDRGPDDAQYAERLQDAVADLARRVQANEPHEELEQRISDIAERIDATLARTQVIEATVATLAESLEGVTEGVEEAFREIQTGTAELAQELVRIDGTLAELGDRPVADPTATVELANRVEELATHVDDPTVGAAIDNLQASVSELLARPLPDETLPGRVEDVAARLDTVADRAALDDLRRSIGELEARPAGDPALWERLEQVERTLAADAPGDALTGLSARLDAFQANIDDLLSRPTDDAEARQRLEQLETTLGSHAAADAVAELSGRIAELEQLGAAVAELQTRLETAPAEDDRLALIEAAVAALPPSEALAELALRIDTLDQLLLATADLEARPAGDHVIDARLQRIEAALAAQPAPTAPTALAGPELTSAIDAIAKLDERIGALDQRLASLPDAEAQELLTREALQRLSERLDATEADREATLDSLRETQDRLALHVETIAEAPENPAVEELRQAIAAIAVTHESNGADSRIEELAQAVDGLRADMTGIAVWAATDPAVLDQIDALAARLDAVDASSAPNAELVDKLAELEARLGSEADAVAELQGGAEAVGALRHRVGELAAAVASLQSVDPTPVAALGERVEDLAASLASLQPVDPEPALAELRRELEARIEDAVAKGAGSAVDETDWAAARAGLEARIDALAHRLDESGAPAESSTVRPATRASDESGGFEVEMERVLMAIERLSMHLAGHDRALAEVMQTRGTMQRLDELSDRIDDIAAGVGSGGGGDGPRPASGGDSEPRGDLRALARRVEETEAAAAADRAKLMDRLDKMASSIDWRLLRLEGSGEPDAGS